MALREPSSGELNRRIGVRRRTDLPSSDMGLSSEFSDLRPRWARIEPVGTAVYAEGVQTEVKLTHRIIFRLLKGITDSHEVVHIRGLPGSPGQYEVVQGSPVYRVKRSADMNGTGRFTLLEVEELGGANASGGIYG